MEYVGSNRNGITGYADTVKRRSGATYNGLTYEDYMARKKRLNAEAERKRAAEQNAGSTGKKPSAANQQADDAAGGQDDKIMRPQANESLGTASAKSIHELQTGMWPTRMEDIDSEATEEETRRSTLPQKNVPPETGASPSDSGADSWPSRVQARASLETAAERPDESEDILVSRQAGASLFTAIDVNDPVFMRDLAIEDQTGIKRLPTVETSDEQWLSSVVNGLSDEKVGQLIDQKAVEVFGAPTQEAQEQAAHEYSILFDYWRRTSPEGSKEYAEWAHWGLSAIKRPADEENKIYEQEKEDMDIKVNYYADAVDILRNQHILIPLEGDAWKVDINEAIKNGKYVTGTEWYDALEEVLKYKEAVDFEMKDLYSASDSIYNEYYAMKYDASAVQAMINTEWEFSEIEDDPEYANCEINPEVEIYTAIEDDTSFPQSLMFHEAYQYMTDEEKRKISLVYQNDGVDGASMFLIYILPDITQRKIEYEEEHMYKYEKDENGNIIAGNDLSAEKVVKAYGENTIENLLLSVESIFNRINMKRINNSFTDFKYPLEVGNFAGIEANYNRMEMENIRRYLNDTGSLFGHAGDLLVFSQGVAQSAIFLPFGLGGLTLIGTSLMAINTADAAFYEAVARGVPQDDAVKYGYIMGTLELLTEVITPSELINIKSKSRFKQIAAGVGNAVIEGTVEGASENLLGTVFDILQNVDRSEYYLAVAEYKNSNMLISDEEARWLALIDLLESTMLDSVENTVTNGITEAGKNAIKNGMETNDVNTEDRTPVEPEASGVQDVGKTENEFGVDWGLESTVVTPTDFENEVNYYKNDLYTYDLKDLFLKSVTNGLAILN